MNAFDEAWSIAKTQLKLFPKEDNEKHMIHGSSPAGYSRVNLNDLGATTSHVNLPFVSQLGSEEDIAREVLATIAHEGTHEAMAKIGEFHDNPRIDEYAPHISEAIVRTRGKGPFTMPPTQLARLLMSLHPQVQRGSYE